MCNYSCRINDKCVLNSCKNCHVCEVISVYLTWSKSGQHLIACLKYSSFGLWLIILVYPVKLTSTQLSIISRDWSLQSELSTSSLLQTSCSSGLCHWTNPSHSPVTFWEVLLHTANIRTCYVHQMSSYIYI